MKRTQCLRIKIVKTTLCGFVLLSTLYLLPGIGKVSAADVSGLKATDLERINPGTAAPDFNLESVEGTRIKLSSFQNQKNVILVFYRGYW